jgi:hypothetical protein
LSYKLGKAVSAERVFVTTHSGLNGRWDPNYYRHMTRFRARVKSCPFPVEPLARHLAQVQYGISERATSEPIGTPMLRMVNLQDDAWDLAELKYTQMPPEELEPYLLHEGDILFNRTNSKELIGKCQVFDLPGRFVFASYLIRVRTNEAKLLPDYVTAYLSLPVGRMLIDAVSRQIAGMTNINAEEIRELLVPRPDLATQRRIVAAWKKALGQREKTEAQARQLLASIDDLLLSELGIQLPPEPPATLANRVFTRPFSELTGRRFDPSSHSRNLDLTGGKFPALPLTKVARLNPRTDFAHLEASPISFVPMEAVSDDLGEADCSATRPADASKSYTPFQEGDVISAKITPCMENGKAAVLRNLVGGYGYGSTEYHVFRPDPTRLNAEYLHALLRLQTLRTHARLFFTGSAGHQRVSEEFFYRLQIPVPPLKTQQRIVEKIAARRDEAKRLRAAASAQLAAAKLEIEGMILG